jgi:hypothetical protein
MTMDQRQRLRRATVATLAAALLGCGGSGGGDVWEIDNADDRGGAPAALLAYVSGLHLIVLDGDDAFAGMTRLTAEQKPGGGRSIALSPSLEAELAPTAVGMELRFSSGEIVPMRKKTPGRTAP